ncbi:MAG: N-acetylmuramoyl-L-alanine amidase [Sporichthyaceae bacterium]
MRSTATLSALATIAGAAFVGPALPGSADAAPTGVAPRIATLDLDPAHLRGSVGGLVGPVWEAVSFDLLGLVWSGEARLPQMSVRTRSDGAWRAWRHLHVDADGPDVADPVEGATAGTAPLWAEGSDGVQLRVEAPVLALPADLRLVLVDPGEAPSDAAEFAEASSGASGPPPIASRAQWKADEGLREQARYTGEVRAAFVHHTDDGNSYARSDVPRMIRAIYAFHVKGRGWADLGYNFVVDRWGRVWEGRAGGVERSVRGAHTGGFNVDSVGIAVMGEFTHRRPRREVLESLARLITWKFDRADSALTPLGRSRLTSTGSENSRYDKGEEASFRRISGHRDASHTLCPGRHLYDALPEVRRRVAALQRRADLERGSAEFGQPRGFRGLLDPPLDPVAPPAPWGEVRKQSDPWARPDPPPFTPPEGDG